MAKLSKEELMNRIRSVAENWREKPETIADFIAFSSRFYRYSQRNTMAIYNQNPNTTFIGSFQFWKKLGYSVKRGEEGLKILVPTPVTLFQRNGEEVQLKYATKQEREAIRNGSIPTRQYTYFSLGTVFDIAQTTCPVEHYPEIYNMGYADAEKGALVAALSEYSEKELHCPVGNVDLPSISLRGYYIISENRIELNDKMQDSEKLSTLAHEIGHAILHNAQDRDKSITTTQIELEADMLALMVESRLGIEKTEGRARHLATHYTEFLKEQEKADPEKQGKDVFSPVIGNVYKRFEEVWGSMEQYLTPFQQTAQIELPVDQPEVVPEAPPTIDREIANEEIILEDNFDYPSFEEQIEAIINDDTISFSNSHLYMGQTPKILGRFGFDTELPMLVTAGKVRNMLAADDDYISRGTPHGLTTTEVVQLPNAIADPAIVMRSNSRPQDSIVVVTDILDGEQKPIIAAIKKGVDIYSQKMCQLIFCLVLMGEMVLLIL